MCGPMGEGDAGAGSGPKLEDVSKFLALGLVVLYLLGFLVVAYNLSQYGVSSMAVLKLQYLLAGIWLLLPLAVLSLLIAGFLAFSWLPLPKGKPRIRLVGFTSLIASFALVLATLSAFGVNVVAFYDKGSTHANFIDRVSILAGIVAMAAFFWYVGRILKDEPNEKMNRNIQKTAVFYFLTASVLILLGYVSFFARNWYPLIPYSLGGGKPASVVFLLKTEMGHGESPVISDSSGMRSIPYKLLFVTDKTFVVLSPSKEEKAIEFNRDAVIGVVMLKAEEGPTPKSTK